MKKITTNPEGVKIAVISKCRVVVSVSVDPNSYPSMARKITTFPNLFTMNLPFPKSVLARLFCFKENLQTQNSLLFIK